jgi:hypothetical protein
MLRAFGWSDEVLTCVSDCLLRPLNLGLGDAGQFSLICLEDGKLALAQTMAVDIVAMAEGLAHQAPLEVAPIELLLKLADDSLLSRYLIVVGLVCESMRDGSQPYEVVSKGRADFTSILIYAKTVGVNVGTHALHRHYPVLTRHQRDVFVSYLCQGCDKLWKHAVSNHFYLVKIREVLKYLKLISCSLMSQLCRILFFFIVDPLLPKFFVGFINLYFLPLLPLTL